MAQAIKSLASDGSPDNTAAINKSDFVTVVECGLSAAHNASIFYLPNMGQTYLGSGQLNSVNMFITTIDNLYLSTPEVKIEDRIADYNDRTFQRLGECVRLHE